MHPDTAALARPAFRIAAGARPYLLTAPSRPGTPKTARDFVRALLGDGPLAALRDTAVLLTSEAVTRAHLRTPGSADILLRVLTAPHGLRISVHDEGPALVPSPAPKGLRQAPVQGGPPCPPGDRDPAHGLLLISRLADDWGTTPFEGPPHTTSLWFELHTGR
ncbi:ATP-binding protein [Streptomyces sp. BHT-5-2]|uniref:ATP-binding protein n=1 Tax=unclassified Streptomyces TaxID=2593676 RepID=UPI001C8F0465|nr:ATP-binding protein [Streptomyces sp. BHT-5-2]QZL01949.1 ATP-binding protein [Streptomyces sp. BHT-5-2]